jgi:hypothetical protein
MSLYRRRDIILCPGEVVDVLIQTVHTGGYSGITRVAVHIHVTDVTLEVQIENVGCCASRLLWRRLLSKYHYTIDNTCTREHSSSVGFEKVESYGIENTQVLHFLLESLSRIRRLFLFKKTEATTFLPAISSVTPRRT